MKTFIKLNVLFTLAVILCTISAVVLGQEEPGTVQYIGHVSDKGKIDVIPRVCTTINKIAFKQGSVVQKGDLLYELDDTIQKLNIEKAEAAVRAIEADLTITQNARAVGATPISSSIPEILKHKLGIAKLDLELALHELSFTKIHTPITGRIGGSRYAEGAYVTPKKEPLTTIVPLDPVIVSFNISERQFLKHLDANGDFDKNSFGKIQCFTADSEPCQGKYEFDSVSNTVDSTTGSVTINLRCENPEKKLRPGGLVYIKVTK